MRQVVAIVVALLASSVFADEKPRTEKFAKTGLDKVPAGWTAAKTGTAEGSVWKVVADDTTPSKSGFALAQTAAGPGSLFNLCVVTDSTFKDGEVSAALRAVAGKVDQGGGVVWRYQDAD